MTDVELKQFAVGDLGFLMGGAFADPHPVRVVFINSHFIAVADRNDGQYMVNLHDHHTYTLVPQGYGDFRLRHPSTLLADDSQARDLRVGVMRRLDAQVKTLGKQWRVAVLAESWAAMPVQELFDQLAKALQDATTAVTKLQDVIIEEESDDDDE